jgi:hypothetical protein
LAAFWIKDNVTFTAEGCFLRVVGGFKLSLGGYRPGFKSSVLCVGLAIALVSWRRQMHEVKSSTYIIIEQDKKNIHSIFGELSSSTWNKKAVLGRCTLYVSVFLPLLSLSG